MFRSALFIPCANARALAKARDLDADALIFDLEDAVGESEWAGALAGLVSTLEAGGIKAPNVLVRIHPVHLDATADALGQLVRSKAVGGIVVPKVETPDTLHRVRDALPRLQGLWAMIETPLGVARLTDIAGHVPLAGLIAGPNDLRKGLRTRPMPDRQDILFALSQIVLHARAHGLVALDGVYNQFKDEAGFLAECRQGRDLGFDGKTLIHPSQVAGANAAFSPSADEIAWAEAVVGAFENSEAGVISVNGEMVERLHLEQAREILNQRRDK
ncbi:HpcH/HpaI aldolase/citrate lyase family protein [Asticcacaulis solisilvae]|uniref:HpcH/HpaI aldolase/citrate lyase family protein n=1 Tax=Asticcacaulis solisilvae TaxID=1217274 RepID=UPI003FD727D0